ncbi:MAG: hypothetical protein AB1529_00660 [Candidatus Micrarchaeota archaeon]
MDVEALAPALRKMKVGELDPELRSEIATLARELGRGSAITASSSLHFLLKLYRAEKAKERGREKALKRAEELILRLSSLHHDIQKRESERRREERGRRIPFPAIRESVIVSGKLREMFGSIGITDEGVMGRAVELLGEERAGERVDMVKLMDIGPELTKRLFSEHPDTVLIPKEDDFVSELEAIEAKKGMIDSWREANGREPPMWADYDKTPGILVDTYEDITRLLNLEPPETAGAEQKEARYRGKPMDPDDFSRVVMAMGFSGVRESKHGRILSDGKGNIMCVQRAHRKQEQLNPSTIKKKLTEAGVDLDEFEKKRRELKL